MKHWSSVLLATFIASTAIYSSTATQSYSESIIVQANSTKDTTNLEKKARDLIILYSTKNYEQVYNQLPELLQSYWTPQKLGIEWEESILARHGDFQKILSSKQENIVNGNLVIFRVQFSKDVVDLILTFNQQGEVVGFNFPQKNSIEEIAKNFVEALGQKKYAIARNYLHPYLKVEIFPEKIKAKSEAYAKSLGGFEKVLGVEVQPLSADQDVAIVNTQFKKGAYPIFIIFDKQKNVVGVNTADS